MSDQPAKLRIDKWLWHARFFKTRGLAAKVVTGGHVRLNGTKLSKSASLVVPGDVLTFPAGNQIRVVRVEAIGSRRGPAPEAQALYHDMTPPPASKETKPAAIERSGKGRPTKKDRRDMKLSRDRALD